MPANKTRSLRSIRTLGSVVDRRKARSRAGALQELAALEYEKQLLRRELERCERRKQEIHTRLAEVREKEERLERAALIAPVEAPVPLAPVPLPDNLRVKSFEY